MGFWAKLSCQHAMKEVAISSSDEFPVMCNVWKVIVQDLE